MARPQRITQQEIHAAFGDEAAAKAYPPILTPEQFARLFQISVSTAYFWVKAGRLDGAVTKTGKHLRIWRDRAVETLFNRNKPKEKSNDSPNS
jgi:uncharacterized protein YmfQ (DUF2313 family)